MPKGIHNTQYPRTKQFCASKPNSNSLIVKNTNTIYGGVSKKSQTVTHLRHCGFLLSSNSMHGGIGGNFSSPTRNDGGFREQTRVLRGAARRS